LHKIIAARITDWCAAQHVSLRDLEGRSGLSRNSLASGFAKQSVLGGHALARLAMGMHVSADWLLGLTEDPSPAFDRQEVAEEHPEYNVQPVIEITVPVAVKPGQKIVARIVQLKEEDKPRKS
jgi:transcriptional regulator with XRE-family HTH domain